MIQKHLEQATRETLHFFFNWDEYIINQLFFSALLALMLCRTFAVNTVEAVITKVQPLWDSMAEDKEQVLVLQGSSGVRISTKVKKSL